MIKTHGLEEIAQVPANLRLLCALWRDKGDEIQQCGISRGLPTICLKLFNYFQEWVKKEPNEKITTGRQMATSAKVVEVGKYQESDKQVDKPSQAWKIEFLHAFLDLLEKYDGAKIIEYDLESDVVELCKRYSRYNSNPLGKKYAYGKDTYTPLHLAARQGNLHMVRLLCSEEYKNQLDMHAKTETRQVTALHLAAVGGHYSTVEYLVKEQNLYINAVDKEGSSVLHYATYGKHNNLVKWLIEDGKANVSAVDEKQLSVLHVAVHLQCATLVRFFLHVMPPETIDRVNIEGKKAVHYAKTAEIKELFCSSDGKGVQNTNQNEEE
ncbi:MAG: ankyrin repeat domain-containing protein [Bacteroidota bacterium]